MVMARVDSVLVGAGDAAIDAGAFLLAVRTQFPRAF